MIIPPRLPWREVLAVMLLPLALAGVVIAGPLPPIANPFAAHPVLAQAEPVATATPEPVEACPEWRKAGTQIIYRCIDEEQYITCYSQGLMLYCLPQQ